MTSGGRKLVYLTGFMGSGKSTVGPILANTLGYSFADIDREISATTGKTISRIFSEEGEASFRKIERGVLIRLSMRDGWVIALGGGTLADERSLHTVKSTGVLVYLRAQPDHLRARLRHKTDRPLLHPIGTGKLSEAELDSRIRALLGEREPFYALADLTVTTDEQRVEFIVDEIVRGLRQIFGEGFSTGRS